jgi:phosphatidylserine/phosphatidylglycerophosphate/cardiolipin synthase-like enzyme
MAGLLVLVILFVVMGSDPLSLFETGEDNTPVAVAPQPDSGSGGDWWQVYFTDPNNMNDPTNLAGSIPEKLIAQFDRAQNSIDIAAFEFNLPPVADALIAASQRGVAVRWMTDDEFGIEDDKDELGLFELLEGEGVEVRDDDRDNYMHNKFIIIDNQTVWTGSTNITNNGNFRNNNNVIVIDSPSLAAIFQREFDEMWQGEFGARAPSDVGQQSLVIEGSPIQVYFAAEDHPVSSIVPLVEAAEESVRFMAFSFTHDDLGAAMLARDKAGVDVKGVFETRGSKTEYSEFLGLYCANVPTRLDGNPAILHHKVLIIDDRIVITGSANFSNNADRRNDENLIVIDNEDIARLYLQEFDRRWAEAVDPDPSEIDC